MNLTDYTDSIKKGDVLWEKVKVWYDPEGISFEVMFGKKKKRGILRETGVRPDNGKGWIGNVIGFSILKVSSLKGHPLEVALCRSKIAAKKQAVIKLFLPSLPDTGPSGAR